MLDTILIKNQMKQDSHICIIVIHLLVFTGVYVYRNLHKYITRI